MPTLDQLRAEPWWDREIVTPELRSLGAELCRRTGRPADAFGTKGNTVHLNGAHRSQEWILNSRYCTNRTYTVQAGLVGDQLRYVAGVDWTPGNVEDMIAQSQRLMAEVKAGRLEEVRELYCNVDGDQVVDGWDNVRNRAASSDSSHLWHWHLSLDRTRVTDAALMARIADIVAPQPKQQEDKMLVIAKDDKGELWLCDGILARPLAADQVANVKYLAAQGAIGSLWRGGEVWPGLVPAHGVKTTTLAAPNVDVTALAAALLANETFGKELAQKSFEGAQRAENE